MYLTQEMRDSDTQRELWSSFYGKLTDNFNVDKIPEEEQHINYRSADILLLRISKKWYINIIHNSIQEYGLGTKFTIF